MTKCGKSVLPGCEYFATNGCVSPFNCPYKVENESITTATSTPCNLYPLETDKDEEISRLQAEVAELRARLEKAVELPVSIGGKIWEIFDNALIFERNVYHIGLSENRTTFRLTGESGLFYLGEVELTDYKETWFTDRAEAEARLKELQKEDEE